MFFQRPWFSSHLVWVPLHVSLERLLLASRRPPCQGKVAWEGYPSPFAYCLLCLFNRLP